jgi:NADPH:quinone reductase-like Zn-dependent oxidoreductase
MKAVVYEKYGAQEVLKIQEVEKPSPADDEVLVRVVAVPVTIGDVRLRKADPFLARAFNGLIRPKNKILGMNFAGVVEDTGKNVKLFKKGDKVFGSTVFGFGTYAEYITVKEDGVITQLPAGISFEEASAVPFGTLTSLHFLRKGNISKGKKVLVYGASGSLGTSGVQLAHYFGAEVTGVCSTANIELVKSLGADKVIDYTIENIGGSEESYDIIYDAYGKSPFLECIKALKKDGYYLRSVHMSITPLLLGLWTKITSSKKVVGGISIERKDDLQFLAKLMEEGKLKMVIDRCYSMEQMAEAHRYVDLGHKKGNVVVNINYKKQT